MRFFRTVCQFLMDKSQKKPDFSEKLRAKTHACFAPEF
jgi:hypothetical protein